ncbi:MAG TPA: hypothetical protein VLF62_03735 [Candidatus Saccharimonadales bacterium]|nr:hypothetical protein [Candidatus Saccharimonadales bacterium]
MRLYESKKQRNERLSSEIAAVHTAMAQAEGPVGNLARLYDRLHRAAGETNVFTAQGHIILERRRAMYVGGVAFAGRAAGGQPAHVDIRRTTTCESAASQYAELNIFVNDGQSRIRARLYSGHRSGNWQSEGSIGRGSGNSHMSQRAPEFKDIHVVGRLVGDVALLAAQAHPAVVQAELPSAPHPAPYAEG